MDTNMESDMDTDMDIESDTDKDIGKNRNFTLGSWSYKMMLLNETIIWTFIHINSIYLNKQNQYLCFVVYVNDICMYM